MPAMANLKEGYCGWGGEIKQMVSIESRELGLTPFSSPSSPISMNPYCLFQEKVSSLGKFLYYRWISFNVSHADLVARAWQYLWEAYYPLYLTRCFPMIKLETDPISFHHLIHGIRWHSECALLDSEYLFSFSRLLYILLYAEKLPMIWQSKILTVLSSFLSHFSGYVSDIFIALNM